MNTPNRTEHTPTTYVADIPPAYMAAAQDLYSQIIKAFPDIPPELKGMSLRNLTLLHWLQAHLKNDDTTLEDEDTRIDLVMALEKFHPQIGIMPLGKTHMDYFTLPLAKGVRGQVDSNTPPARWYDPAAHAQLLTQTTLRAAKTPTHQ